MFTNLLESINLSIFNLTELEVTPVSGILGLSIIFLFIIAVVNNRGSLNTKVSNLEFSIIIFLLLTIFVFIINFVDGSIWLNYFLKEFLRVTSIFCFYYIVKIFFVNNDDFNLFLKFLLFISIFSSLFGVYQLIFKSKIFGGELERIYGTAAHANSFALLLIFFSAILFYFIFTGAKKISKIFLFLYLLLLFILLIFTYSRAALIFFILFVFFVYIRFYRKKIFIIISVALVIILLFGIFTFPLYKERLQILTKMDEAIYGIFVLNENIVPSSFSWRLINYKGLLDAYVEKPLFGYGLGSAYKLSPWGDNIYAHSDYIKMLVETGIIGFSGFLFVLGILWYFLFKKSKLSFRFEHKLFSYLVLCFFTVYIFASFFTNYFMDTFFQYLFWSQIALISNFEV